MKPEQSLREIEDAWRESANRSLARRHSRKRLSDALRATLRAFGLWMGYLLLGAVLAFILCEWWWH